MALEKFFKFREGAGEGEVTKPFLDHLDDLRSMLVKCAMTLGAAMFLSFFFRMQLVRIIQEPLRKVDPALVNSLKTFGITDPLIITFQLAFYAGLVLSFPFLLYFIAQFVLPALTKQERKYVFPAVGIGFGLFLLGVVLCYEFILPRTLEFFFGYARSMDWTPMWTVPQYFSFVTQMTFAFGLAFELPVVVVLLICLGFLTTDFLRRTRAYALILILLLAIAIAPTPDVVTFLSLGFPMCILYEACIWAGWLVEQRRKRDVTG